MELLENRSTEGITVLTGIPEWDVLKNIDMNMPVEDQAVLMANFMVAMSEHIKELRLPPFEQLVEEMALSLKAVRESGYAGELV